MNDKYTLMNVKLSHWVNEISLFRIKSTCSGGMFEKYPTTLGKLKKERRKKLMVLECACEQFIHFLNNLLAIPGTDDCRRRGEIVIPTLMLKDY